MATGESVSVAGHRADDRMVAGASLLEALGGAAAIVLPILGLLGVLPVWMTAISAIVIGAALVVEGSGMAVEYSNLFVRAGGATTQAEAVGGTGVHVLGGVAGIALGILALVGLAPMVLLAVALIVLGATLALGSGAVARLNLLRAGSSTSSDEARMIARDAVDTAAGTQILAGLGVTVLGILVLAEVGTAAVWMTLLLVGMLAMGGALVLSGTAIGARMLGLVRR